MVVAIGLLANVLLRPDEIVGGIGLLEGVTGREVTVRHYELLTGALTFIG